ncbi:hypothetical protein P5673_010106 [Acropora cervicornis]|uniref:Uncharacterized protein n=1 Tax=Acropora cervicornis TaxID=6130 RepID=A0AAD9QR38_ACRCE|nr:hypothetical protein P5673_010106 [Acropora cervicornis]
MLMATSNEDGHAYPALTSLELCCPEGGVYNKMVTFLFELLVWLANGRLSKHYSATGKPRYDGTDDIELGEK